MTQVIADRRDIDFVLYEQFDIEEILTAEKFEDLDRKVLDMIISEARKLAINEILPTFAEGDKTGARFENGEVRVPECFHRPYKLLLEGEWTSMIEDPEFGGQGLPHMIAAATGEYLIGANYPMVVYAFEGHGTGKMIELYGTEKQKELFVEKLYTGQWGGTMDLTEPQAGSDVGAIATTALKNADGTYSLTGNKIFITNGEHDLTENIIHPVLARVEGAPSGAKGLSLFIVPKFWVNDDGTLGERNDILCTGIEDKMGLHGSATCSISMGAKGICRGLLLGEENQGIQIMFHMMNEARLDVGFQGFTNASSTYLHAVNYARERLQGKDLEKMRDRDAPQVAIIRHPDVRRMLIGMKAYVDGMRSFIYYICRLVDRVACAENSVEKERLDNQVALLTPIAKAYCAERGFEVCIEAIQVFGGYGYTREYPLEQHARDAKIASIFEGTDGIQAMDLLGRKLGMKGGAVFGQLLKAIGDTTETAKETALPEDLGKAVKAAADRLGEIALYLGETAMSPDIRVAFANAHPFLTVTGDVIMAWMLLWRAVVAAPKLETLAGGLDPVALQEKAGKNKEIAFYSGQIRTAEYFITSRLPVTTGLMNAIAGGGRAVVDIHEDAFGSL